MSCNQNITLKSINFYFIYLKIMKMVSRRNLPGATGVIDLKAFLTIMKSKGYKGCISAEPFNKKMI